MSNQSSRKPLAVLAGPTASGKTALATELIRRFPFEIVSADSRQVYRGLDIGTGKDKTLPQAMIDVVDPPHPTSLLVEEGEAERPCEENSGVFSVSRYREMALPILDDIWKRGKTPLIVGGTGYYIDSLIYKQSYNSTPPSSNIRQQLDALSNEMLLAEIEATDQRTATAIGRTNRVRLIRAVEVIRQTKKPIAPLQRVLAPSMDASLYVLDLPREELYKRIDQRVDDRLEQGMVEEVAGLLKSGISHDWLISLGLEYRFIAWYLLSQNRLFDVISIRKEAGRNPDGVSRHFIPRDDASYEEMVQKLKFGIHAYARRQISYFKRWPQAEWLEPGSLKEKLIKHLEAIPS